MYKDNKSQYWYITYTDASGKRVRRSSGTADRAEAEQLEAKLRRENHRRRKLGETNYTFDELMMEYLRSASPTKKSHKRDIEICRVLKQHFSNLALNEIKAEHVRKYKETRAHCTNSTIRRELSLLSSAINWARSELDWDIANPVENRMPPKAKTEIRWLTIAEQNRLLAEMQKSKRYARVYDFTIIGLYAGMRPTEIMMLTEDRIDLEEGLIYIRPEDQKNGQHATIPIHPEVDAAIRRRIKWKKKHDVESTWLFCHTDGTHIQDLRKTFSRLCKAVGIQNISQRNMRHTCASRLLHEGVPIEYVSKVLRHSSINITLQHYGHLRTEETRKAVSALKCLSEYSQSTIES